MRRHVTLAITTGGIVLFLVCSAFHVTWQKPPRLLGDKASFGSVDNPYGRLRHEWKMLHDPRTGEIPRGIRQGELEFARTLPVREDIAASGDNSNATWTSRGPWNVGGRTRALGIDINNPNIILAGGVSGGMWRSVDGGSTWTKTTAIGSLHSVSCLAQDKRAGQTSTWYYGTGELLGNSTSGGVGAAALAGDGIFKSTNNGASWTQLASSGTPQFDRFIDYVWNIAVHPTTGAVYAATFGALYRSTDGGTNWTAIRGAGSQPYSALTDVAIASNGTIYVTGSPGDPTIEGIWKSTDGNTWQNITPGDMSSVARIVIGIAPSNPNTVYFLAETPNVGTNNHSIWKYNAATNTYENRSANLPAYGGNVGNFDSQNSYDLVISVKPNDENFVLIGGTNLYRSTNGFASTAATAWIGGYSTANDISIYENHHPDCHSLAWDPTNPSVLYSGHDGGVSKSSNIAATPHVWTQLSRGYLTTQFYTIAIDHGSTSADILGGLQDNGCYRTTSTSSTANWVSEFGGDGAATAIPNGGGYIVVSSQNGRTYLVVSQTDFARLDPQGGSGYLFINPFILDQNNSNIMYFAGGNYVWRNSNITTVPRGSNDPATANWTRLNNSAVGGQTQVSALAVSKTNPANRLFIGHSSGTVVRVDGANAGDPTGLDKTPGGGAGSYVSSIAIDPTDGNKVIVVYSNYGVVSVFSSVNGGDSWTNVEGNLAGTNGPSCRTAAIVPSGGTTTYYLGTSTGLYSTTSLNGGSTVWTQEGPTTIGNVVVQALDSRTTDGLVVAATHANGVYATQGGGGGGGGTTTTVYAGDANNDRACDVLDILPIGRFFGLTGPARAGGSTTWGAQTATVWSNPDATYADCDGNGSVQAADVQALIDNYGRTRSGINDRPEPDKIKVCNALLREIDRQASPSPALREIRREVVRYMQQQLGVSFDYALAQNYPNPFNPSTTIRFTVPTLAPQSELTIFDIAGQAVWSKTLTNVETGTHEVEWNGTSSNGEKVASGMYIYRLRSGNFSASKRMLMLK